MFLKFDKTFLEFTTFCRLDVEKISREIGLLINSDCSSKRMINFSWSFYKVMNNVSSKTV